MREEKHNKVVAAITVNAVLLVFILVAIIIAQIVQISVLNRRKQELRETYAALMVEKDRIDKLEDNLEEKLGFDEEYTQWLLQYIDVYGDEDPLNIFPDGVIIK